MSNNRLRLADGVRALMASNLSASDITDFIGTTYQTYAQGCGIPFLEVLKIVTENMPEEPMVLVTQKHLDWLTEREEWLSYLDSAGVDNWSGIDYAYQMRRDDGKF